jgi:trk system potassium uptake protein TrkA
MAFQCAVLGLGRFGTQVALGLAQRHVPVLAVDADRDVVDRISNEVDHAVCFNTTNEAALRDARIQEMDVAVCALGDRNVEDSILTTALLRQIGVRKIVARASTDLHARILRIVGASLVVNPEKEMGIRIAQRIVHPELTELIPLSSGAAIAELPVPQSFVGQTMIDLRIRSRYGVNVVGMRRLQTPGEGRTEEDTDLSREMILMPPPDQPFAAGDILIVAGSEDDVKQFASLE